MYEYEFEMSALTSDVLVYREDTREILVIERQDGQLALVGGYVDIKDNETFLECAQRELKEETGFFADLKQFNEIGVFSSPNRDPRGRTVTTAFYVKIKDGSMPFKAGDDAEELFWIPGEDLMKLFLVPLGSKSPKIDLAFDHNLIVTRFMKEFTDWTFSIARST